MTWYGLFEMLLAVRNGTYVRPDPVNTDSRFNNPYGMIIDEYAFAPKEKVELHGAEIIDAEFTDL